MKKVMLIMLVVLFAVAFAAAQSYVPTQDVLGAHNNGGRGCAGCHAPHSGALGGGNKTTDANTGTNALFGQDVGPVYSMSIAFAGQTAWNLPADMSTDANTEQMRGIGFCLACHDGSSAKGAMMQGVSYEQQFGILPKSTYGTNPIPTFLGVGTAAYSNDHPVGPDALIVKSARVPVTVTVSAGSVTSIVPKTQAYQNFVDDYGMPAIAGTSWSYGVAAAEDGSNDGYLLCTTCHNQHLMNVYKGNSKAGKLLTSANTYKTYFFINAPYNVDPINSTGNTLNNTAPTASQFCRQCHFGEANENYGLSLPTAF